MRVKKSKEKRELPPARGSPFFVALNDWSCLFSNNRYLFSLGFKKSESNDTKYGMAYSVSLPPYKGICLYAFALALWCALTDIIVIKNFLPEHELLESFGNDYINAYR